MSDFIRQTTEQLAKDGFVAIRSRSACRAAAGLRRPRTTRASSSPGSDPDTVTKDLDATVGT